MRADRGRGRAGRRRGAARPLGSLVRTSAPLRRGIQRFTGITQAMVDDAPRAEDGAARRSTERLRGRVMVAHNAPSTGACCARRSSASGSSGPTRRCCARPRWRGRCCRCSASAGSTVLADALGIEVEVGAPGAGRRRDVRARAVRAVPAAVRQRRDGRRGAGAARSRRPRGRAAARAAAARSGPRRPAPRRAPAARLRRAARGTPGVYLFRDGAGPDAVRRQVGLDPQPGARALRPLERARRRMDRPRVDRRLPDDAAPSSARWCWRTG